MMIDHIKVFFGTLLNRFEKWRKPMKIRLVAVLGGLAALSLVSSCGLGSNPSEAENSFSKKQVSVYEKDKAEPSELTCVFNDNTPNIPYVSVEQYLDLVYGEDSDYTLRGFFNHYTVSGKNKNTGKSGSKLKINTKEETLTFDDFEKFVVGKKEGTIVDYVNMSVVSRDGDPKITYDLSGYGMDIHAQDGQVFLPLSTMSDILDQSLTYSDYIDGSIYFVRMDSSGSDYTSHVLEKENTYYDTLTRDADVSSYAYRELCFVLDNLYGRPGRAQSQDFLSSLALIGLDRTLEEGDTMNGIDLKKMKNYLTSTNKAEYAQGLIMLDNLMYDGGHSFLSAPFIFRLIYDENLDDNEVSKGFKELLDRDPSAKETANHLLDLVDDTFATGNRLRMQRAERFGAPSKTWENDYDEEIALIYIFDNTAIFCFDSFSDEVIRTNSGTNPLQEALEYAKENGCDNFILDLSTNGGGSDQTMGYILSVIFNDEAAIYHFDANTGARKKQVFSADKNLDGTINENDTKIKYDFNYAVMTSRYTYSCGNYASILAKESGIPLIGETSGGGGCLVTTMALPGECNSYQLSSPVTMTDSKHQLVDGGTDPDYPLAVDPDGESDRTMLYDPQQLIAIVDNHYH